MSLQQAHWGEEGYSIVGEESLGAQGRGPGLSGRVGTSAPRAGEAAAGTG